jgi:hypothetical protein
MREVDCHLMTMNLFRAFFPFPLNWSATVLKASRSTCHPAAAGRRHSRAPVQGFKARIFRKILTQALTHAERKYVVSSPGSWIIPVVNPALGLKSWLERIPPLPKGEGRGEGKCGFSNQAISVQ